MRIPLLFLPFKPFAQIRDWRSVQPIPDPYEVFTADLGFARTPPPSLRASVVSLLAERVELAHEEINA